MITFRDYGYDKLNVTPRELKAIELMKEMLKLCGNIYEKQINKDYVGSNFYPHDLSKDQILEAAKDNPDILNPYTIVKKEDDLLIIVPYSIEYANELKQIRDLALECTNLIEEENLKGYLIRLAKACDDDSWEELENYWLQVNGNALDLQLAPVEAYMDGLLNIKQGFQGTLRITSDSENFNPNKYIETVKAIKFSALHDEPTTDYQIAFRIDDIIAAGGHSAYNQYLGSNYPNDPEKVKQFGTKILTYANNIVARQSRTLLPILEQVIVPATLSKYTPDEYFNAYIRNLMVHEVCEAFIKYPNEKKRLKELQLPIQELHSSLMGLKLAAQHVLQGAISSKDYEVMLLTSFIGKAFYYYFRNQDPSKYNASIEIYVKGFILVMNYMLEKEAITIDPETGLIEMHFGNAFASLDQLANDIDHLKANGTDKEAKALFDKFNSTAIFDKFKDRIVIE
jgi:hypothetical protein